MDQGQLILERLNTTLEKLNTLQKTVEKLAYDLQVFAEEIDATVERIDGERRADTGKDYGIDMTVDTALIGNDVGWEHIGGGDD